MGKTTLNSRKGVNKNKKQREASEVAAVVAAIRALKARRQNRCGSGSGSSTARHRHVPQKIGRGGARQKLDVDVLDSPSRTQVLQNRRKVAAHRLRKKGVGVAELSEAVLADPTEAWRTKPSGRVNKFPDRARQEAAAKMVAGLPKNEALHGPAVAAFMAHPKGKRAVAALGMDPPQDVAARKAAKRLDALSAFASDIGDGLSQMQASAALAKEGARKHQKKAVVQEPQQRSRRSRSVGLYTGIRDSGYVGGVWGCKNRCQGVLGCTIERSVSVIALLSAWARRDAFSAAIIWFSIFSRFLGYLAVQRVWGSRPVAPDQLWPSDQRLLVDAKGHGKCNGKSTRSQV